MVLTFALLAANWIGVLAVCLLRSRRRKLVVLDPAWAFLLGYFINYCVKPVLLLMAPSAAVMYEIQTDIDTMQQLMAGPLAMSLVFLTGFLAVDLLLAHRTESGSGLKYGRAFRGSMAAYEACSILLILGGVLAFFLFARQLQWQWTLQSLLSGSSRSLFLAHNEGNGHYIFAMHLSQLGWCMFCFSRALYPRKPRLREYLKRSILFCVALFVPLALGQRFGMTIVTTAATFLLGSGAFRILSGNVKIRRLWWAVIVAAVTAGPIGLLLKDKEVTFSNTVAMATSAWDSLELHVIGETTGDWRFLYGRSYLEDAVYSYVPRMWVEKPQRYGMREVQDVVAPALRMDTGTYPPGMVLEAYVNFGWVGVVLVPMLIAGCFFFVRRKISQGSGFWLAQSLIIWVSVASFRGFGSVVSQCIADSLVLAAAIGCALFISPTSGVKVNRRMISRVHLVAAYHSGRNRYPVR